MLLYTVYYSLLYILSNKGNTNHNYTQPSKGSGLFLKILVCTCNTIFFYNFLVGLPV